MAEPQSDGLLEMIERLERRSYRTYKCRLNAFRRLHRANNAWNMALIAFSTSTVIASIGLLVDRNMYGRGGDALMVALAVLSLVASLVVSSIGFGTRAKAMEANYKRIQQISVAAENLAHYSESDASDRYEKLQREYEVAVDSSENHTERDFKKLNIRPTDEGDNRALKADGKLIRATEILARVSPYITLIVPVALIIPFAVWYFNGL